MGTKVKETCTVLSQECIGKDIYSMWIQTKTIAGNAKPGQFVSVYTQDGSKLLPRPISLCEIDKEKGALRLVYRVTGPKTGTESFSRLHAGARLELLGPLGNGFPLEEAAGRKVFLMGGGIGVPPMLETMKQLDAKKIAVLGYRDELFLNEEFAKNGEVYIATEDAGYCEYFKEYIRIKSHLQTRSVFRQKKMNSLQIIIEMKKSKGMASFLEQST